MPAGIGKGALGKDPARACASHGGKPAAKPNLLPALPKQAKATGAFALERLCKHPILNMQPIRYY